MFAPIRWQSKKFSTCWKFLRGRTWSRLIRRFVVRFRTSQKVRLSSNRPRPIYDNPQLMYANVRTCSNSHELPPTRYEQEYELQSKNHNHLRRLAKLVARWLNLRSQICRTLAEKSHLIAGLPFAPHSYPIRPSGTLPLEITRKG